MTEAAKKRRRRLYRLVRIQWCIILALLAVLVVIVLARPTASVKTESDATALSLITPKPTIYPDFIVSTANAYEERPLNEVIEAQDPAPTEEPEPCPITDDEIIMLAKTLYAECGGLSWMGEKYGVSYKARQAAVAWCALNRLDEGSYGDTLATILSKPHQFAYWASTPVTDELLALAEDVVARWWAEKQGETNVGRTLPSNYYYFHGDGRENHFRSTYEHTGDYWNWTREDPYK